MVVNEDGQRHLPLPEELWFWGMFWVGKPSCTGRILFL